MMIIIRNRLISLLFRGIFFAGLLIAFGFYFRSIPETWQAFCYFDIEVYFLYLIVLGFEIIANLIDLRHGIRGVPAGVYMPITLGISGYGLLASLMYYFYMIPTFGDGGLQSLFCHTVFLIAIVADYVAFDEKGTVHNYAGFSVILYIIFYTIFAWVRVIVWPNTPIIGGSLYFFTFLDASNAMFGLWTLVSFVVCLAYFLFLVFLNKALGGRFSRNSDSF